jgi:phosphoglucosamine mutase
VSLKAKGVEFYRANVGDRYVLEMLRAKGGELGGETSGHLLVLDKTTTGDGLVSALQVLSIVAETGKSLQELVADMPQYPQTMINVRTPSKVDLEAPAIQAGVAKLEAQLGDRGRVVLRASGTEPVVRVMVEGQDHDEVVGLAEELADVVRAVAAG